MAVKVDDVPKLFDEKMNRRLSGLVLAYLENHPDEVFRPKDKEELAAKVGWPKPGPVAGVLCELARNGLVGRLRVRQYIIYGKRETIEGLRKRLPEEVMLTKRELAKRRLGQEE